MATDTAQHIAVLLIRRCPAKISAWKSAQRVLRHPQIVKRTDFTAARGVRRALCPKNLKPALDAVNGCTNRTVQQIALEANHGSMAVGARASTEEKR
ncbi:hypothetical protein [Demequina sediminicola]|uniref:hypothetical protein n=1 Tax=Demequina sediminicola TaxID=1095026 RepID=UPI00078420C8|nr:hypothetical protein [Demequina sediminicola]